MQFTFSGETLPALTEGCWDELTMTQQTMWESKVPGTSVKYLEALSKVVPKATLDEALKILQALKVAPKLVNEMVSQEQTLHQIVHSTMMNYNGVLSWEKVPPSSGKHNVLEKIAQTMAKLTWYVPCLSSTVPLSPHLLISSHSNTLTVRTVYFQGAVL
jgi:hypothetical protein